MRTRPRVTVEMVRQANAGLIARKKAGTTKPIVVDFLGKPIDVKVWFDRKRILQAWKAIRERAQRA